MEKSNLLYRFCCAEEIRDFLKFNVNSSLNCEFLSLTKDENSQAFDTNEDKHNYLITLNSDIVYQQGGFTVEYTREFFEANPIVLKHVGNSLDLKLEHFDDSLLHYISYVIEETKKEQEVLVKYLTLTDFLILSIDKFVNGKKINIVKNTLTEID